MDQLRTALAWLKRHHFWVLSVLICLIALFCWWSASGKADAKFNVDQKTIMDGFSKVDQVQNAPFHPNQTINDRQTTEAKKQAEGVAKLWQLFYDRQSEEVLKWPAALSKSFRDTVEKLDFGAEIPPALRDNYQNYIEGHFPELPKRVGARVLQEGEAGGPGGEFRRGGSVGPEGAAGPGVLPGGALVDDTDYICEWLDQSFVRDQLNFPQRPTALQIWVTQEDLWVYHTLLDVIAKTNQAAGATRKSNAAVKVIGSLQVGQRAAEFSRTPNRLLVPPAMAAPGGEGLGPEGGGMGPEGGGPGPVAGPGRSFGPEGGMGREGGLGPGGGSEITPDFLLGWRYLDEKGQPIPMGGAAAVEGEVAPPEPAPPADPSVPATPVDLTVFGREYKRLPIRMVLEMDGRWLPHLIAACANQPLRVEVQEVRINPSDVTVEGGGPGGGMRGGFERGGPSRGPGETLFAPHTGLEPFPSQPNLVTVVIQGIIYVFNKPNPTVLQPPGEGEVPAEGEVPVEVQQAGVIS